MHIFFIYIWGYNSDFSIYDKILSQFTFFVCDAACMNKLSRVNITKHSLSKTRLAIKYERRLSTIETFFV